MLVSNNLKLKRLQKQQQQLISEPISNVLVKRNNDHDFHFVIYNLEGEYKGGFYHGLLQLHENYPFAAPKLFFYTPSGRFQINIPICTSFTNYHQESWTSAWNVRSLLLGTVSFMTSDQASYGCRSDSKQVRKNYAARSLAHNLKNPKFCELFLQQLTQITPPIKQVHDYVANKNNGQLQILSDNQQILIAQNSQQTQNQAEENQRRINNLKKIGIICVGVVVVGIGFYFIVLK